MSKELADACYKGDYNLAIELIKNGTNDWNRGLCHACAGGHKKLAELMIEKGANHWEDGLSNACKKGHKELALLMIEKGANNWNWGLFMACFGGHKEIVELMLEKNPTDINHGLYGACMGKHKELAFLMIEKGANVNEYNLDITSDDILYIIQKGFKNFSGKSPYRTPDVLNEPAFKILQQTPIDYLIQLRKQERTLLDYILINDLVNIIMSY